MKGLVILALVAVAGVAQADTKFTFAFDSSPHSKFHCTWLNKVVGSTCLGYIPSNKKHTVGPIKATKVPIGRLELDLGVTVDDVVYTAKNVPGESMKITPFYAYAADGTYIEMKASWTDRVSCTPTCKAENYWIYAGSVTLPY